jgi:protein-S-isoprenylcysteine O-methyltransferase Ste14
MFGSVAKANISPRRHPIAATLTLGLLIFLVGFGMFLHSLGGGGGFLAMSLMVVGAILLVASIVFASWRAMRAILHRQRPS